MYCCLVVFVDVGLIDIVYECIDIGVGCGVVVQVVGMFVYVQCEDGYVVCDGMCVVSCLLVYQCVFVWLKDQQYLV